TDLDPSRRAAARRGDGTRAAVRLACARHRGRALPPPAAEGRRLSGIPLRRPPLSRLRQDDPAPERGGARLLPRPGLPRHAAERRALAGDAAVPALLRGRGPALAALLEGLGTAPVRGARRPVRLLLPDPRQDRSQARLARGRRVRGALRR